MIEKQRELRHASDWLLATKQPSLPRFALELARQATSREANAITPTISLTHGGTTSSDETRRDETKHAAKRGFEETD